MKIKLCLLLIAFGLASVRAEENKKALTEGKPYQGLIDNSPFLTPSFRARLTKHDSTTLNFIGYTRIDDVWYFALMDRKSGQSYWLKKGEESNGIVIASFEESDQRIQLTVGGIAFELRLVDAGSGNSRNKTTGQQKVSAPVAVANRTNGNKMKNAKQSKSATSQTAGKNAKQNKLQKRKK